MTISLIGFMGCGKSSVGRRLSELLCCPFIDLDAVIEERAGRSIPEIFASDGEAAFRQMEIDSLRNILEVAGKLSAPLDPSHSKAAGPSPSCYRSLLTAKTHRVISQPLARVGKCQFRTTASQPPSTLILSLGGGTVMTPECAEMVRERTTCIYLRASVDTLVNRLEGEASGRPLLQAASLEAISNVISSEGDARVEKSPLRLRIEELMSLRSSTYKNTAHIIIDTDGKSISDIGMEISDFLHTGRSILCHF